MHLKSCTQSVTGAVNDHKYFICPALDSTIMNYIDYEDELADAFCEVQACEYDWSVGCVHRPENPMMRNILQREMFGQTRYKHTSIEDAIPMIRKRRIHTQASPLRGDVREKMMRLGTRLHSMDDMHMMYEMRDRNLGTIHYSHQRVVSDDSASENSVFSQK